MHALMDRMQARGASYTDDNLLIVNWADYGPDYGYAPTQNVPRGVVGVVGRGDRGGRGGFRTTHNETDF